MNTFGSRLINMKRLFIYKYQTQLIINAIAKHTAHIVEIDNLTKGVILRC